MIATFQGPAVDDVTPALVTLAAGWASKESPSMDEQTVRRMAQLAPPSRSAYKIPYDRGLNEIELVFSVTLQFDTEAAVLAYQVAQVPLLDCSAGDTVKNGTLTFTDETDDSQYQLINAVCSQIGFKKIGVSLTVTYRFVGSYWSIPG